MGDHNNNYSNSNGTDKNGNYDARSSSFSNPSTSTKSGIDELINKDRVVIFSKQTCPYCHTAKEVFEKLGQSYSTVELTTHPKGQEVQKALKELTGAATVPRVFVDGVCIGGGTDTLKMYETGKLEKILREESNNNNNNDDDDDRDDRGGEGKWY